MYTKSRGCIFGGLSGENAMRIILKECKKVFDIKIIIILAVFTALFYIGFMEITIYPAGGQFTDSQYDVPFRAELIKEWGVNLSKKDWSKVEKKRQELKAEFEKLIVDNKLLKENNISTFDEFNQKKNELSDKKSNSKKEKELMEEIDNLTFENSATSKILFNLQALDKMETKKEHMTKDYVSLLHEGVIYMWNQDVLKLCLLLLICFFVLIVYYQVKERLSGGIPIFVSTHTGRRIFKIQFLASLISCTIVGLIQILLYLFTWYMKGLSIFWDCESWCPTQVFWNSTWKYGTYIILELFVIIVFLLATVSLIYTIARFVPNYVVGIAVSIPVCIVLRKVLIHIFDFWLSIERENCTPFIVGWLMFMGLIFCVRRYRDLGVDL